MNRLLDSELILNKDGSIYHLGIKPEHLAPIILTVGDQDRVDAIAQYFDTLYFTHQNREFKTVKGRIGKVEITIISTGIGTDNIDIVLNEIAFLLQFDLETRTKKSEITVPQIIRLGTSGSVSPKINIDNLVYSKYAISMDDLFKFYVHQFDEIEFDKRQYEVVACSALLEKKFVDFQPSLTLTAKGFYGPQFRNSALTSKYTLDDIAKISYRNFNIGNIEMETAGIYGMSQLLGFEALSINAILADRLLGKFSTNPEKTIEKMIIKTLEIVCN